MKNINENYLCLFLIFNWYNKNNVKIQKKKLNKYKANFILK